MFSERFNTSLLIALRPAYNMLQIRLEIIRFFICICQLSACKQPHFPHVLLKCLFQLHHMNVRVASLFSIVGEKYVQWIRVFRTWACIRPDSRCYSNCTSSFWTISNSDFMLISSASAHAPILLYSFSVSHLKIPSTLFFSAAATGKFLHHLFKRVPLVMTREFICASYEQANDIISC